MRFALSLVVLLKLGPIWARDLIKYKIPEKSVYSIPPLPNIDSAATVDLHMNHFQAATVLRRSGLMLTRALNVSQLNETPLIGQVLIISLNKLVPLGYHYYMRICCGVFLSGTNSDVLIYYKDYENDMLSSLASETTGAPYGGLIIVRLADDPLNPYRGSTVIDVRPIPELFTCLTHDHLGLHVMQTIGDLDGNGAEEIFLNFFDIRDPRTFQYLLYMAPSETQPILRFSKITSLPSVFNIQASHIIRIHDIDGDGLQELLVTSHCGGDLWKKFNAGAASLMHACLTYLVYPQGTTPEEDRPFSRSTRLKIDEYTRYWSEGYAGSGFMIVKSDMLFGWSTNFRIEPARTSPSVNIQLPKSLGDLNGDLRHEIGISMFTDTDICTLIISSRNDDYTDTFSYPAVCNRLERNPNHLFTASTPFAFKMDGFVLLTTGMSWNFNGAILFANELPYPLREDSFNVTMYREPIMVEFPVTFLVSRYINIILAVLGFVLAAILLVRLRKAGLFRRDEAVKSLLHSCVKVLSFFNLLYSGFLSIVLLYDLQYLKGHNLLRSFTKGEIFSADYFLLLDWLNHMTVIYFSVRQLAWADMYWHGYLAYVFLVTANGAKPIGTLQRSLPLAILLVVLLVVLSTALETSAYLGRLNVDPLLVEVIFSGLCTLFVLVAYIGTCMALRRRTIAPKESPRMISTRNRAIIKLMIILGAFIVVWTIVIFNTVKYLIENSGSFVADVPSAFLTVLDSIVLGNVLAPARKAWRSVWVSQTLNLKSIKGRGCKEDSRTVKIFCTTWNMGGVKNIKDLKDLGRWIPAGGGEYDMIVLAFQENAISSELMLSIHSHLGTEEFTDFSVSIGESLVVFGLIGIFAFVRTSHVKSGLVKPLSDCTNRVRTGVNLVVDHAANKGSVGLAFHLMDSTVAFVSSHLAADIQGKCRYLQRNDDAFRSMKGLKLGVDMEMFDFHLMHTHVVLMGDLNYRIPLPPEVILKHIQASAQQEDVVFRELCRASGLTGKNGSWRDQRYEDILYFDMDRAPEAPLLSSELWNSTLARLRSVLSRAGSTLGTPTPKTSSAFSSHNASSSSRKSASSSQLGDLVEHGGEELKDDENNDNVDAELGLGQNLVEEQIESNSKTRADIWSWVSTYDELLLAMKNGLVFDGFMEAKISFPPSFKWRKNVCAADFTDMKKLKGAYKTVNHHEGKASFRPPSYTDRILYHSQPAAQRSLKVFKYQMCDAIMASDHRPVSAAMEITIKGEGSFSYASSLAENSMFNQTEPGQKSGPLPESTRLVKIRLFDIQIDCCDPHHPIVPLANTLIPASFTQSFGNSKVSGGSFGKPYSCMIYFPLQHEDPLLLGRKIILMGQALNVETKEDETLLTANNMQHLHSFHLDDDGGVLEFRSLVCTNTARHALVRVMDEFDKEIGQALLPLDLPTTSTDEGHNTDNMVEATKESDSDVFFPDDAYTSRKAPAVGPSTRSQPHFKACTDPSKHKPLKGQETGSQMKKSNYSHIRLANGRRQRLPFIKSNRFV